MKFARLSKQYKAMILAQTPRMGDAHFIDAINMLCMGGEL